MVNKSHEFHFLFIRKSILHFQEYRKTPKVLRLSRIKHWLRPFAV